MYVYEYSVFTSSVDEEKVLMNIHESTTYNTTCTYICMSTNAASLPVYVLCTSRPTGLLWLLNTSKMYWSGPPASTRTSWYSATSEMSRLDVFCNEHMIVHSTMVTLSFCNSFCNSFAQFLCACIIMYSKVELMTQSVLIRIYIYVLILLVSPLPLDQKRLHALYIV